MEIKRVLKITFIFVVLYLITGFIYPLFFGVTIGDIYNSFKNNFSINKSSTLFALFVWPLDFGLGVIFLAGFGGQPIFSIFSLFPLVLLIFFGWLAYYIEKKLFLKKEV